MGWLVRRCIYFAVSVGSWAYILKVTAASYDVLFVVHNLMFCIPYLLYVFFYLIFEEIMFLVGIPTTLPAPCVVVVDSNGHCRVRFNLEWAAECCLVHNIA